MFTFNATTGIHEYELSNAFSHTGLVSAAVTSTMEFTYTNLLCPIAYTLYRGLVRSIRQVFYEFPPRVFLCALPQIVQALKVLKQPLLHLTLMQLTL